MQYHTNKTLGRISSLLTTLLLSIFVFTGCQKELSEANGGTPTPPTTTYDLSSRVTATISGFVTNELNQPVSGASVQVGGRTETTDDYGYFEAKNVSVVKNAAVVKVDKPGYFPGIKTLMMQPNKAGFTRIKLIPKSSAGTISAASGGAVTLPNGLKITLPANAVVTAATNTAYTGTITVNASWIDPTATDLGLTMPGDLRGLRTNGAVQTLTTFGMAAVELTGAGGEKLQIASGKTARLTVPLPSAIQASAPTSIPLWHFNETTGLWEEEGTATKNGNQYEGEVSHFSFWNCDVPANFVQFNVTVIDANNNPIRQAMVKISRVGNPYDYRIGFTDTLGYVSGAIPANSSLVVEVFTSNSCGTAAASQNITTTTSDISLGNITIPPASMATITGNVINCSATPVTNGYLMVSSGGVLTRYPISNTGTFNIQTPICSGSSSMTFVAEDVTTAQQGNSQTVNITAGNNNIGTLTACGVSIDEFINYTINSAPYGLGTGSAFVQNVLTNQGVTLPATNLQQIFGSPANTQSVNISFTFTNASIATNSIQELRSFQTVQINDSTSINAPISVNITEYGAVGQFIAGNFTGVVTGAPPTSTAYNITCSFRVRRRI